LGFTQQVTDGKEKYIYIFLNRYIKNIHIKSMENISIKNTSATPPVDLVKLDPHNMDKLVIYMSSLAIKIPSKQMTKNLNKLLSVPQFLFLPYLTPKKNV
jgi:hypothetical protein